MKKPFAVIGAMLLIGVGVWGFVGVLIPFFEKNGPQDGEYLPAKTSEFPELRQLKPGDETALAIALDEPMVKGKNLVYSPIMRLSLDELASRLEGPIRAEKDGPELFKRLLKAKGYENSLAQDEYYFKSSGTPGDGYTLKAIYEKSLPFEFRLGNYGAPIAWENEQLRTYTLSHHDEDMMKQFHILHYKNDDQFIISLQPSDPAYIFILAKGFSGLHTLAECVSSIENRIAQSEKEIKSGANAWKYSYDADDSFLAPAIEFNLAYEFIEMENITFFAGEVSHFLYEIKMQVGFVLDENGGEIYVETITGSDSIGGIEEKPRPQHLIFDKPFIVIVKKKTSTHPALVVSIQNTALLRKSKEKE